MFFDAYKRAWEIIKRKPLKLWGYSVLAMVILTLVSTFAGPVALIGLVAYFLIIPGLNLIYLDELSGKEATAERLFQGLNKENFQRVLAGMAWCELWTIIWSFVPVYGIYKMYTYRFVPYILLTKPEVAPMDALHMSKQITEGKVLNMFLCDLCWYGGIIVAYAVLSFATLVFAMIPILGIILSAIMIFASIVLLIGIIFAGQVFTGLYQASFYESELEVAEFDIVE